MGSHMGRSRAERISAARVLGETFTTYREHLTLLLGRAFILFAAIGLAAGFLQETGGLLFDCLAEALRLAGFVFYAGSVVRLVQARRDKRPSDDLSLPAAFLIPQLVIFSILLGSVAIAWDTVIHFDVATNFPLSLVGLVLLMSTSIGAPAIVVEKIGPLKAFVRGWRLSDQDPWGVARVFLPVLLVVVGAWVLLTALMNPITSDEAFVSIVSTALAAPVFAVAIAILYFELVRQEQTAVEPAKAGAKDVVIAVLCVLLPMVFAAGLWLGGHPANLPPSLRDVFVDDSVSVTEEARELIEENYYRPVSKQELTDLSLAGMLRGLRRHYDDRFSQYLSAEMLARDEENFEGHYSGLGVYLVEADDEVLIHRVYPHSPADRAGIHAGEAIVSVDERSIVDLDFDKAMKVMEGPEGTAVTLGVRDADGGETRRERIVRTQVTIPVVTSRMETVKGMKLGYVRLAVFNSRAYEELRRAVAGLQKRGAQGLVLDLRTNGGGLLDEAVLTASIFLPKGETIVSLKSRHGHATYKTNGGNLPALPIVVLINRYTASAAELLTAALADNAGAQVVGERSFGKGVFQAAIGLSNGGALRVTAGEYFTPNGDNLAGKGVHPDVQARDVPDTPRDEAAERALEVLAGQVP
jgi:carboxyl-terminal processing protease